MNNHLIRLCLVFTPMSQLAFGQSDLINKIKIAPDNEVVRIARKLSGLGIESSAAIAELTRKLKSKNVNVRGACVDAIPYLGKPSKQTIQAVIDSMQMGGTIFPDAMPYGEVAGQALAKMGPDVVPIVVNNLETKSDLVYFGIAGVLHRLGPQAKEAVPALMTRLGPGKRQWSTVYALCGIGPPAHPATAALIDLLESDRFNTVCIACRALAAIGPRAKGAKRRLVELVSHGNVSERGRALQALGGIGVANEPEVKPLFEKGVVAFHQTIKERAVLGISCLGAEGKPFIPLLEQTLLDPAFHNKPYSAWALYQVGGSKEKVMETLLSCLDDPTFELDVIEKLGKLGSDAKKAVPKLMRYLGSSDDGLKSSVIQALGAIGLEKETRKRIQQISIEGDYL
ncbi:MAG: hypothetical protein VX438_19175, partial [Planctomycetota bacterium]|nr:hypothetical protein [Planctomycetota bacterium]